MIYQRKYSTITWLSRFLQEYWNTSIRGEDAELQGISYQIVTTEHMLEMQNLLRRSLGKEEVTEVETNAVLYEAILGRTATPTMLQV